MSHHSPNLVCAIFLPALLIGLLACGQTAVPTAPNPPAATQAEEPTAPLTLDQVLDKMEVARKKLETFKAQAVKLREIEVLEQTEKFVGNIQFKMPRLLRLELKSASEGDETIIFVGKTYAWKYRPQKKQAERATLKEFEEKAEDTNPLEYGLAKDIHDLRKAYTLALLPPEKICDAETLPIELNPTGRSDYTTGRLIFWIDKKLWLPVQVREFKSNGEIVETHTFSEVRLNERIRDKEFEFKPPKDVEEILH